MKHFQHIKFLTRRIKHSYMIKSKVKNFSCSLTKIRIHSSFNRNDDVNKQMFAYWDLKSSQNFPLEP